MTPTNMTPTNMTPTNMTPPKQALSQSDLLSSFCDECRKPAFKVQKDAANIQHVFCKECWNAHVEFSGNAGKPYGF
jgi:hypothetical protein